MAFGLRGDSDRDAFIHYVDELRVPEGWKLQAKLVKLARNPILTETPPTKAPPAEDQAAQDNKNAPGNLIGL